MALKKCSTFIASSSPPGVARELSRLRRPRPPSQSEGGCRNEAGWRLARSNQRRHMHKWSHRQL